MKLFYLLNLEIFHNVSYLRLMALPMSYTWIYLDASDFWQNTEYSNCPEFMVKKFM